MAKVELARVVDYLDRYLRIGQVPDEPGAVNGLQVENGSGLIERVVAAVDLSQETIDGVIAGGRPERTLVVVHHGLLWDGNVPIRGRRYRRLRALFDHDVAVYSAHIPLDVHPEVGNNVLLARRLGCIEQWSFDQYKGIPIGIAGRLGEAITREELASRLDRLLATATKLIAGGAERITTIGVITGGAGSRIAAAKEAGVDGFVTGEGAHHTYFDAMELGINVYYAGHYATERVGIEALAEHLAGQFAIPWEFHDHPTGL